MDILCRYLLKVYLIDFSIPDLEMLRKHAKFQSLSGEDYRRDYFFSYIRVGGLSQVLACA